MKIGDVMLAAICGLVIITSAIHIDKHYSTNVEQQKQR